jgi:CRISPR-associated endonuclease/helicase Cas3
VLIAPRGLDAAGGAPERPVEPATEDDFASCFADGSVTLTRHTRDVVANTRKFAEALQLSPRLAETLSFAAEHHDDGKADPRFQDWLKGPNSTVADLLAKSGRSRSLVAESVARATAGVPARWRHEVLSVRIATRHLAAAGDTIDQALALYLIGSHHGYGRPFFPHHDPWDAHDRTVLDAAVAQGPGPERLDFDWQGRDWAELFADLETKYGAWGLAFLEAVLRLADHRASEKAT